MMIKYVSAIIAITIIIVGGHILLSQSEPHGIDKLNITYENYTINKSYSGIGNFDYCNSYGHGDGICSDSYTWCKDCNCTVRIERWCDNETEEMEKYRRVEK